ncbi:MAG TPA: hypothetical protein VMY36_04145 [Patescibacteria group bacterium]|nr:hypothetical protein [Patescibacteria group bacterium]
MKKKKEPRWEREQKQRKENQSRKVIIYILVFISLILFVGFGWRILNLFRNSVWDGDNRLNLVLNIQPVAIASFDPGSQTMSFLTIPDGTYIEAAGEYGPYRIEKIYPLGELEGKGIELLADSIELYFGMPIDGWLDVRENWQMSAGIKSFFSRLIGLTLKDKSLTNLSRWDLFRLWLMVARTRSHKIEMIDLGETTVAEDFILPDGQEAQRIDNQRISRVVNNLFTDYRLREEGLAIAMMNASGETGLATKRARLITNIGGRLIEVGDWPEKVEGCQIKTTSAVKKSYTSQKLAKIFDCQIQSNLGEDSRWDILIILGQNEES